MGLVMLDSSVRIRSEKRKQWCLKARCSGVPGQLTCCSRSHREEKQVLETVKVQD